MLRIVFTRIAIPAAEAPETDDENAQQKHRRVTVQMRNVKVKLFSGARRSAETARYMALLGTRTSPGFLRQFAVLLERSIIVEASLAATLAMEAGLILVGAVLVGVIQGAAWALPLYGSMVQTAIVLIGTLDVASSLRLFGKSKSIYWREAASNVNRFSYWSAKVTTHTLLHVWSRPLLFVLVYYNLILPRTAFSRFYAVFLATTFCTTGTNQHR
ncbi:MAG: hypothetical protein MHM6MM_004487 [Cercozoa sp. M6MM]